MQNIMSGLALGTSTGGRAAMSLADSASFGLPWHMEPVLQDEPTPIHDGSSPSIIPYLILPLSNQTFFSVIYSLRSVLMTHLKLAAKTLFPSKVMVTSRISLSSLEDTVRLLLVIRYGSVNSYYAGEESKNWLDCHLSVRNFAG